MNRSWLKERERERGNIYIIIFSLAIIRVEGRDITVKSVFISLKWITTITATIRSRIITHKIMILMETKRNQNFRSQQQLKI